MSVSRRIKLFFTIIFLLGLTVFYPFIVYSTNSLVTELRTLWISTAMETMTHQWLATAFFPENMVTEVVEARKQMFESQKDIQSVWVEQEQPPAPPVDENLSEEDKFYARFDELERESAETFFAEHPRYIENGYEEINMDWCEKKDDTGIVTKQGDKVVAINTQKDLMVIELNREGTLGTEYTGYLAIVKDPPAWSWGCARAWENVPDSVCRSLPNIMEPFWASTLRALLTTERQQKAAHRMVMSRRTEKSFRVLLDMAIKSLALMPSIAS